MDTISDVTKVGQLITKNICIPLNSAFWNKDEFNNKMLHSSQTENCPFTLRPTICIENVNENILMIFVKVLGLILFKYITIWYHLLQIHIGLKNM